MKGHFFMIVGPSGVGKSELIKFVLKEIPTLQKALSHTTRNIRKNEKDKIDYHFISKKKYLEMLNNNEMIMHYQYAVNNEYYGTSKKEIIEKLQNNLNIIDETDEKSVSDMIKQKLLDKTLFTSIYILTPSEIENINRLKKRKDLSEEEIIKRIENIKERLKLYLKYKKYFDYELINDNFEKTSKELKKIILNEMKT